MEYLANLPRMVRDYIQGELNSGEDFEAIHVKLLPVSYPDLPADEIDDMIAQGIYANREQIASSVLLELDALSGHTVEARFCAVDDGLSCRSELVDAIINTVLPFKIKILRKGV